MTEAILLVIEAVSFLIILIIMAVMANTMAMTARERRREYATLKAIGFDNRHVVALIAGESLVIAVAGGILGVWLLFPAADRVAQRFSTIFPIYVVADSTLYAAAGMAFAVGVVAAFVPAWRAAQLGVAGGFRAVG
jgi:putative ABC transport system permease protein